MKMLRKTWRNAEKRIGKPRPASGAMWYAKGDVITPSGQLAQVKSTTKKQYSLKLRELVQIEEQAASEDREALFVIEFETPQGPRIYSVQRYYPEANHREGMVSPFANHRGKTRRDRATNR